MKAKYITLFILFLSVLSAFADKKMTVKNSDTGESFKVSIPDGLKIYEYNSNWLDSIPYLLDRARYGEPWAYEALGDCYRYGRGGVQRSILTSIVYYVMSEMNVDQMASDLVKDSPRDCLGLVYQMIDRIEASDEAGIRNVMDMLGKEGYHDADVLEAFLGETSIESLMALMVHNIMAPEVGTDEMLFTVAGSVHRKCFPDSFEDTEVILRAASTKFPYLYDQLGMSFFKGNIVNLDSNKQEASLSMAIDFLREADKHAFLSREGAKVLYDYNNSEFEAGRMELDYTDMERLATLARLPESDKFIFTDK